jgi:type II secretory pathway component HofQ
MTARRFIACAVCTLAGAALFIRGSWAQTASSSDQSPPQQAVDTLKKELTPPAPVIEIKRLESEQPAYSIELRNVALPDLFRVMAHDYNLNMVVDSDVSGTLTASFTNVSLEEALQTIADMSNLVVRKKGSIIRISLNLVTRTFTLKNIETAKLVQGQRSAPGAVVTPGAVAASSLSNIYDLLSNKGKILVGSQPNSLMVIDYPANIDKVALYLEAVDLRMSSRVFKLKYLKAGEVVGDQQPASPAAKSGSGGSSR